MTEVVVHLFLCASFVPLILPDLSSLLLCFKHALPICKACLCTKHLTNLSAEHRGALSLLWFNFTPLLTPLVAQWLLFVSGTRGGVGTLC